ncbi:hypothetical protein QUA00_32240 [Microcoleus sp. T2B6]|uniref:hypothetical protein n=1 Tax=Microcoleus sp. T2B6 TaxID=3055424 RepID=UPI002FD1020D
MNTNDDAVIAKMVNPGTNTVGNVATYSFPAGMGVGKKGTINLSSDPNKDFSQDEDVSLWDDEDNTIAEATITQVKNKRQYIVQIRLME